METRNYISEELFQKMKEALTKMMIHFVIFPVM